MNYASIKVYPSDPVFFVLSDPAKSTKFNFEKITFSLDSIRDLISKETLKIQWDLLENLFILWAVIVRFVSPSKSIYKASSSEFAIFCVKPFTRTAPRLSSNIVNGDIDSNAFTGFNKSNIISL